MHTFMLSQFGHDQLRSDALPMKTPNEGRHFIASSLYTHSGNLHLLQIVILSICSVADGKKVFHEFGTEQENVHLVAELKDVYCIRCGHDTGILVVHLSQMLCDSLYSIPHICKHGTSYIPFNMNCR